MTALIESAGPRIPSTTSTMVGRAAGRAPRSPRDSSVDVARAACLTIVVLLHAMMVGVSTMDGAPVIENAMDSWPGFAAATWVVQVMPLFFVLGGFSSLRHWSALRDRGATPAEYVALRLRRLLVPAVAAMAVTSGGLLLLPVAGATAEIVAVAGFRLGQPLWFLGVYVLCTALVPVMVALHGRRPIATFSALAVAVAAVDVARAATGMDAIGFLNLLFVWLLIQQTGFALADGSLSRVTARGWLATAGGAFGVLFALCSAGVYAFDLFGNLNPPTGALVLLGIAQLCLFARSRPLLRRLHRLSPVATVVGWINARSMTIYAWHMLVLIGLASLLLVSGADLPTPVSGAWWATRPLWLLVVLVTVGIVAAVAGRREGRAIAPSAGHSATPSRSSWRTGVATLLAGVGVLAVLVAGTSPVAWAAATLLIASAIVSAPTGVLRPAPGPAAPAPQTARTSTSPSPVKTTERVATLSVKKRS